MTSIVTAIVPKDFNTTEVYILAEKELGYLRRDMARMKGQDKLYFTYQNIHDEKTFVLITRRYYSLFV